MNSSSAILSGLAIPDRAVTETTAGPLDGKTILRFAHAFASGGGTERYLDDLDRALLDRSAMTIVRLHLTRDDKPGSPQETSVGRGQIVQIGLPAIPGATSTSDAGDGVLHELKQQVRNSLLYNPLVWRAFGAKWTLARRLPRRAGEAVGAGNCAADVMRSRPVDLAMMHFFGGSDADEIIAQARTFNVPVAVLNHYSNDRFLHLAIRKHALEAQGVAGVNGLQLPRYLRHRFTNLADGIDTDLFSRSSAHPVSNPPAGPVILLPARVIREKGQLDLVRAAESLRALGISCSLVFAGRCDTSAFQTELQREIARAGLTDSTRFVGNLSVPQLRDWYAASTIVAFPTYHHEGLGRVIIEAQSMEVPVVAYATGGVASAIEDRSTGMLVRTGDIENLTAKLRLLLTDPAMRASLAARGRIAVEKNFSLAALAKRHEDFYLRLINAPNGSKLSPQSHARSAGP
jgi:glycosyltransferase involved in cell wall biosynthesis